MIRSSWGQRVAELQAEGLSLHAIARSARMPYSCVHRMLNDPRYDPRHSTGSRFLAFHATAIAKATTRRGFIRECSPLPPSAVSFLSAP